MRLGGYHPLCKLPERVEGAGEALCFRRVVMRKRKFKSLPGIYRIVVLEGSLIGRTYIGSSKNVSNRLSMHIEDLQGGKHHNTKLQNVFNKYGLQVFEFYLIEYVSNEMSKLELRKLEKRYMDDHVTSFGREWLLNETMSTENAMDDPEVVARWKLIMKELWEDPDFRKGHSERRIAANSDPVFKERMREITKNLHKDPVYKAAITGGIRDKWANDLDWRRKMVALTVARNLERVHEVYCYETSKIFRSIGETAEWLKSIGYTKTCGSMVWKACVTRGCVHGFHFDYIENVTEARKSEIEYTRSIYPTGRIPPQAKPIYCYELNMIFGSSIHTRKYLASIGLLQRNTYGYEGLRKSCGNVEITFCKMHWCYLKDITEKNKLKYANKSFPIADNS